MPPVPMPATRQSDTLVLIHNGHNQPCNMSGESTRTAIERHCATATGLVCGWIPLLECCKLLELEG